MDNPLVRVRLASGLTQRDVAADLGKSQQYVQKMEEGLSTTAPDDLCHYWDVFNGVLDTKRFRYDYLMELQSTIRSTLKPGTYRFPDSQKFGTPDFKIPTTAQLYRQWIIFSRASLPALHNFLEPHDHYAKQSAKTVGVIVPDFKPSAAQTVAAMVKFVKGEAVDNPQYALASILKINPFIVQRWVKTDRAIPPTLRIAVEQTGRAIHAGAYAS